MRNIEYLQFCGLTREQVTAFGRLVSSCERHDKTRECIDISINSTYAFSKDISLFYMAYSRRNLIGAVSLFIPTPEEAEVTAFVRPSCRKTGIFSRLMENVRAELRHYGIPDILFVCNEKSISGQRVMQKAGADYEFTEYSMERTPGSGDYPTGISLRLARDFDIDYLTRINCDIFGESEANARFMIKNSLGNGSHCYLLQKGKDVIGMSFLSVPHGPAGRDGLKDSYGSSGHSGAGKPEHEMLFIYGFGLLQECRGSGLGKESLHALLNLVDNEFHHQVGLEADSDNAAALALYRGCGFRTTASYRYYRIRVS